MRPALEVADIFRRHGEAFRAAHADRLSQAQRRVMAAIEACRTAALGGHVEQCDDCGEIRIAYNSCRNRHCPKCQGLARAQWLADRQAELLPVPYFHVVFTVPAPIAAIALQNKAVVYDILFQAAAETLRTIAADPEASRRRDRLHRRAAHLGPEPARIIRTCTASCRAAACRPTDAGSPAGPASSCPSACSRGCFAACSWNACRPPSMPASCSFFGDLAQLCRAGGLRRIPGPLRRRRMGGLRQAPVRRAAAGARVSRPLHPPRRHLQQPPARLRGRPRPLPLEGLSRRTTSAR